jgi:hypothetical protein
MGVSIEGQVGPRYTGDGSATEVRQSRFGGLVVTDAHGRYWEACSRGNVFCAANTAAQATSTSSATATGLILSNPAASGKYLSILDITVGVGAAVAAAFEVGLFANVASQTQAAVTHTTPITPRCALIGSGAVPVGLVDSAATLPAAPVHIRTLLASGWVTATAQSQEVAKDEIAGAIILMPNTAVSIQSIVGTQSIIASITWEETQI